MQSTVRERPLRQKDDPLADRLRRPFEACVLPSDVETRANHLFLVQWELKHVGRSL